MVLLIGFCYVFLGSVLFGSLQKLDTSLGTALEKLDAAFNALLSIFWPLTLFATIAFVVPFAIGQWLVASALQREQRSRNPCEDR